MPRKISQEFIIMDAFPLPVEGTETRVNAGAGANEFMVTFTETCERIGPWSCDGGDHGSSLWIFTHGGFLSHGGTPKSCIYRWVLFGISMK